MLKTHFWIMTLSCLLLGLSGEARGKETNPWQEKISQLSGQVKPNNTITHLADISVVRIYDRWKWEKKKQNARQYARGNQTFLVTEVLDFEVQANQARFVVQTASGERGWLMVNFPFADTIHLRAGLFEPPAFLTEGKAFRWVEEERAIFLETPTIKLRVQRRPFRLLFFDHEARPLLFEPEANGLKLGPGLCEESFEMAKGEGFFGLGEQYGHFNHRGHFLVMDQDDAYQSQTGNTYLPIPFFLSSRGWGLLLNTYQAATFDFGQKDRRRMTLTNPNSEIDYYLFVGQPLAILAAYTRITGRAPLIPRWSLEPWISRRTFRGWDQDTGPEREVQRMLDLGFPLGVVLYEHMLGQDDSGHDLRINRRQLSRMPELINRWHEQGIKVVGWMNAGQIHYDPQVFPLYGLDRNPELVVRNPDGSFYLGGIHKNMVYLDVTNAASLDWAWTRFYQPLFLLPPQGRATFAMPNLDGIKLDFCEFFPGDQVPLLMHDRLPGMRLYHPTFFSQWLYERINAVRPEGGITWTRGAGLGAQKIGFVWTGDRGRTFPQLRHTHLARINACISGIALIGTDLGGYIGGGLRAEEVYNRAVAIDCFSPSFHDHGSALAPWEQSQRGQEIYRFYARLRYNLIPYLYSLVWEARTTGLPLMRPLFFHCPEDKSCWQIYDQYLLGQDVLVAPVLEPGVKERELYLPAGEWLDFWTRERLSGPGWITRPAPREIIPVLIRQGAILPVQFNAELRLGGAFAQEEKDRLLPGFLIFASREMKKEVSFKVSDPRQRKNTPNKLRLSLGQEELRLDEISPLPAGVLLYGFRPQKVSAQGADLSQVSCQELHPGKRGWCYRQDDGATVISLSAVP